MSKRKCKGATSRAGVAAVEFAVVAPLLCLLFVVVVDFCRIFYFAPVVTNCARSGAIYGSQNPTTANDQTKISEAALLDASNLTGTLTVTSSTDSATNPTYVIVTASYPFATISRFPGVASTTTITRTVRLAVTPLIPD